MAHFTEASFSVENRILIEKTRFGSFSRPPRPTFQSIFDLKMAIFQSFSSQILTYVPINVIFGIYLHNSPSFKGESIILTPKVTEGHLRSSEVKQRRSSEVKKWKKLVWELLFYIKFPFKRYTIHEMILSLKKLKLFYSVPDSIFF